MVKVVIDGKIVEKSRQGIQRMILEANPHLLNKFKLPKLERKILLALLEEPRKPSDIAKRLGISSSELLRRLYPRRESTPLLLQLNLIQRCGKKGRSFFRVNAKKLKEIMRLTQSVELADPTEAAVRYEAIAVVQRAHIRKIRAAHRKHIERKLNELYDLKYGRLCHVENE